MDNGLEQQLEEILRSEREKLIKIAQVLKGRYWGCDRDGHREPVDEKGSEGGFCTHCFRHLNYQHPNLNFEAKKWIKDHFPEGVVLRIDEDPIAYTKANDWMRGLAEIKKLSAYH